MVQARSIGRRAFQVVSRAPRCGSLLACFDRVWDLAADGGEILALAWEPMVEGPFNILLAREPGPALPAGTRFFISGTHMSFGAPATCPIELNGAQLWEPRPDWAALRARAGAVHGHLPVLAALLALEAHEPGRAISAGRISLAGGGWVHSYERRVAGLTGQVLAAHSDGDGKALDSAVAALCGLGPGLTPAGDDWLAGWLVALWLAEDSASRPGPAGRIRRRGAHDPSERGFLGLRRRG